MPTAGKHFQQCHSFAGKILGDESRVAFVNGSAMALKRAEKFYLHICRALIVVRSSNDEFRLLHSDIVCHCDLYRTPRRIWGKIVKRK